MCTIWMVFIELEARLLCLLVPPQHPWASDSDKEVYLCSWTHYRLAPLPSGGYNRLKKNSLTAK